MTKEIKTDREGYEAMLERLDQGLGVLTSNEIHPDIPTIHEVSHREGARLKCDYEVKHYGFGLFMSKAKGKQFSFDGGGAMSRCNNYSWTLLRFNDPGFTELGYDVDAVRAALEELIASCGEGGVK